MYAEDVVYTENGGLVDTQTDFIAEMYGGGDSGLIKDVITDPVKDVQVEEMEQILVSDPGGSQMEQVTIPTEPGAAKNNTGLYIVIGIVAILLLSGK